MNNHSQIAKRDPLPARLSDAGSDLSDSGIFVLLEQCLQASRDELLWTEFIRRSQPVIAGVVARTIRRWSRPTPALVDDLVQETYLKLFANNARALRRFVCHHENALYGFLKVVASNVVQDHFRSLYSQKRGSGHEEEDLAQVEEINIGNALIVGKARKMNAAPVIRQALGTRGTSDMGRSATEIRQQRIRGSQRRALAALEAAEDIERNILLQEIDAYLKTRASEPTFSRDYSIFWLYYSEGLTAKAIAAFPCIGLTVKGVESTLLRLTRLVRRQVDPGTGRQRGEHYWPGSTAMR
jgi:RNA polymerase sigma-70 factor (ECF subfamily)